MRNLTSLLASCMVVYSLLIASGSASAAEDWKGDSSPAEFDFGALAGMGVIDSQAGFALLGTVSKKIVHRGFAPDINDSVSIEAEAGPLFVLGTAAFAYSLHLRWDFRKDENWVFYALGGAAGNITGAGLGNRFILFPRFGIGAMYDINGMVAVRGELSRELIAAGVSVPF